MTTFTKQQLLDEARILYDIEMPHPACLMFFTISLIDKVEELEAKLKTACELAAKQAEDEGLWFDAQYASEAYLQNALRELAASIEGK